MNLPLTISGALEELERIAEKEEREGEDGLDVFEVEDKEEFGRYVQEYREAIFNLDRERYEAFAVWNKYLSDQRNINGGLDVSILIAVLDRMAKSYEVSDKQFWVVVDRIKRIDEIMVKCNTKEDAGTSDPFDDNKTQEIDNLGS